MKRILKLLASCFVNIAERLSMAPKESWRRHQFRVFAQSVVGICSNILSRHSRSPLFVEYNMMRFLVCISNITITKVLNASLWLMVRQQNQSVKNMESIRKEIRGHLSEYKFKNILEGRVSYPPRTSITSVRQDQGVDLSLNRLEFGLAEFAQRHQNAQLLRKRMPFSCLC